ncbi:arginine N-succinyltransferase [Photobacterium angustum]|uniref:arginine N-succinyltransferase n=1 Tax=Photobacterium angustum TaxID=661 RepID=UPI0005DF7948|nr:arginine N-succinyltransferase [Photobacterium angustum]KJF95707.1 arginine N-succinyltransferase [Photobacterium angustum]KJG01285.1 arginine N-succinyltransferase [Photobacterium angustum]KJG05263.1 arginine N-succinyltransferase [Photobacterium angustum]KJG17168.1 arginine N-succinyltransferase [Photobacterium angustum]KJG23451.1 arginine N-succinyltransferase [Photobacterium angustum]
MLVIRPIIADDYSALMQCAEESGHGFTSLPVNEEMLRNRIAHSERSFAKHVVRPEDEGYLMVAEDTDTGEIAGTTAIEAAIGLEAPFYNYHLSTVVHASRRLGVHNTVQLLTLGNHYTGDTELCTLFLRTPWREGLNGRLLSKARFLMMAEHRHRFADVVFAEMRGVSDEEGNSPFWQWLKDNFFSIDFIHADYLTGIGAKGFIADLMPKLPIYVNLLSKEAQAVIGQVHDNTRPALRLLENEGFSCRGYVDIFDAGPTVECDVRNVETVRHSKRYTVEINDHHSEQQCLVANTSFTDFRAVASPLEVNDKAQTVVMTQEVADTLMVNAGEPVRFIEL